MTSTEMITELKALEKRRSELSADVEKAGKELETARERILSGKADVSGVTAAQSTYNALSEALAALDARILERRAQLAEATREEQTESRQSLWRYGLFLMLATLVVESFIGRPR